jgi:hypothetical protein
LPGTIAVFGVDLEDRARADRKRVLSIITTLLVFFDLHYPDLESNDARKNIWLVSYVPLENTYIIRNTLNTGHPITLYILEPFHLSELASVLKLYLLELPGIFYLLCPALVLTCYRLGCVVSSL